MCLLVFVYGFEGRLLVVCTLLLLLLILTTIIGVFVTFLALVPSSLQEYLDWCLSLDWFSLLPDMDLDGV